MFFIGVHGKFFLAEALFRIKILGQTHETYWLFTFHRGRRRRRRRCHLIFFQDQCDGSSSHFNSETNKINK
jgi:hypothetical protein